MCDSIAKDEGAETEFNHSNVLIKYGEKTFNFKSKDLTIFENDPKGLRDYIKETCNKLKEK